MKDCFVYLLLVNELQKYGTGKSRIVYIGCSDGGVGRLFSSAAKHIYDEREKLDNDFEQLDAYMIWAKDDLARARILERDTILAFKDLYGSIPKLNEQGSKYDPTSKSNLFSAEELQKIIHEYGEAEPSLTFHMSGNRDRAGF